MTAVNFDSVFLTFALFCICILFSLDYAKGFGGKYGVEKEKVDKAAVGYDYKGETEKHQSQKGEFKLKHLSVLTPFL